MENFLGINWYHIRITKDVELEDIEKFVKENYPLAWSYIISKETLPRTHFHICLKVEGKMEELREKIKKSIYGGRCNYYFKPSKNVKQMLKYTLKDGDYVYKGIEEKEIELLKKTSNKKGLDKFGVDLTNLEEQYLGDKIRFKEFGIRFVKLKISYGQNLYSSHIKAYLQKMKFKKEPEYIGEFIDEMFRSFN